MLANMRSALKSLLLILCCLFLLQTIHAAVVDTVNTYSASMKKTIKAVVITPDNYANAQALPVVYLLHGYSGNYADWITKAKGFEKAVDLYQVIIVCPDGNNSWYWDSPVDSSYKYETYVSKELVNWIDSKYKTIRDRKGRAITGLSMGGHGALYLALKHQDVFGAAGSMSGVMNINTKTWKVPVSFAKARAENFARLLGAPKDTLNPYVEYTIIGMTGRLKANDIKLIFDVGVDDFLIETNRDLHKKLLDNGTPHDYTERPGKHDWSYWTNALPSRFYFSKKC